jgi:hypothetical protein
MAGSKADRRPYIGNAGQLRLITELCDAGRISSTYPGNLYRALDAEWVAELRWSRMNVPLSNAVAALRSVEAQVANAGRAPTLPIVDGTCCRVAMTAERHVVDWFGTDGLPRRLQRFSGTIVGYQISDMQDIPLFTLRLRRPLGYAVYALARYSPESITSIDVTFADGIPVSFRLWNERSSRTLSAHHLLAKDTLASGAHVLASDNTLEVHAVDMSPGPDEVIEQQIIGQSIQTLLERLYGRTEGMRVLEVFAEWDQLTQDEGSSENEAYREIEARFGISRDTYLRYKSELAHALVNEGLGNV